VPPFILGCTPGSINEKSHPSGGFKIPHKRHIYRLRIKPPCPLGSVGGSEIDLRALLMLVEYTYNSANVKPFDFVEVLL
jgi:hypothetical protein